MREIIDFFKEAIGRNHLSHSYLIAGTESSDLAKDIAKMVLCRQEHTACGSCSSCLKIMSDNHPDYMLIEPDGASIKNAQVEDFQDFIYIRPFESDHKIVVFNQSHLMTDRAQNRILKVLEEPPEYALFLFLTHQPEGMLETVLSRCQLIKAKEAEKVIDDEKRNQSIAMLRAIMKQDTGTVLSMGSYMKQIKAEITDFLSILSSVLRDVMIFRETGNYQLISVSNLTILNYKELLFKASQNISRKLNVELIELIEETDNRIKSNMNFDLTVDKLLLKCIEREA